jgi:hypothetical protein
MKGTSLHPGVSYFSQTTAATARCHLLIPAK